MQPDKAAALLNKLDVNGMVRGTPIHPKDNMRSPGREEHYFSVGADALRNIVISMIDGDKPALDRILDFPSGFGRVTRYLRAAFPDAEIHIADIWKDAVTWTGATFSANIVETAPDFSSRLDTKYDVIFCGSLLTHLPENLATKLLDFLLAQLEVGGLALVSASGRKNLAWEKSHFNQRVFETPENLASLTRDYYEGRYAFANYPGQVDYGRSFTPVPWFHSYLVNNPDVTFLRFSERSWDDNQDMAVFKRMA